MVSRRHRRILSNMRERLLKVLRSRISGAPLTSAAIIVAAGFLAGVSVLWASNTYFFIKSVGGPLSSPSVRLSQSEYPLISPLLLCNASDQRNFNQDSALAGKINGFVQDRVSKGAAEKMSVYLVNYQTGQWAGVDEDERYDPASMLKVPLMVAFLKYAQSDPGILSQQLAFNGTDQNAGEYFKSSNGIQPGVSYSVDELLRDMIGYSDNNAAALLEQSIDQTLLKEVYTDLGLPVPVKGPNIDYISVKSYASFFRVLYNATYLDYEYSEKALELLALHDFPQGIESGVPASVTVAQKFGERSVYSQTGILIDRELHDCGIVYKPGSPFLLCIMSRGQDFDVLAKNISDLSALIYKNIGSTISP
ncbi:MAG: serine hydrolase [Patescibacteria group bacterium]|nr:serine hydrolase [Patescibacteria group bacterium]